MSEEDKKKLKEYQKNYCEAKTHASRAKKCKRVSKKCITNIYFFRSFINFYWIKWCFNNIIKVLCMAKWAIHESLLLLLKHHFIH